MPWPQAKRSLPWGTTWCQMIFRHPQGKTEPTLARGDFSRAIDLLPDGASASGQSFRAGAMTRTGPQSPDFMSGGSVV